MNLDGIVIQNYIYHYLREMDNNYVFSGKTVMFLSCNTQIENPMAILKLGAEKVYFVNAEYKYESFEDGKVIALNEKVLHQLGDNSVDLVIGLEILEHINDLSFFFDEVKRILKEGGNADLHGYPVWTNPSGHHIWLENRFSRGTDPSRWDSTPLIQENCITKLMNPPMRC